MSYFSAILLIALNKDKKFFSVGHRQFCPNMKKVTIDKVESEIESMDSFVELSEETIKKAAVPLKRMLELATK